MQSFEFQVVQGQWEGRDVRYIIKDWTGKVCFHGKEFDDFETAWGYLRDMYANLDEADFDEALGEYFVEVK